jgi:ribonuclease BN (tRNA processing enzyme)
VRIQVLGASGGELRGRSTTSLLVDGTLAVDAGSLTASLDLAALRRVRHVVLSHSHLDHVKDVPLLADLLADVNPRPVTVHGSAATLRVLRRHVFNGSLWPDFTRIPSPARPVIRLAAFRHGVPFRAGPHRILPVRVDHAVESTGFVVSRQGRSFAISGDTGPTGRFWEAVNRARGLGALLVEVSFPGKLQWLADRSGHLTPQTLAGELAKVEREGVPVYLYHLKPAWEAALRAEIAGLRRRDVRILSRGDVLEV